MPIFIGLCDGPRVRTTSLAEAVRSALDELLGKSAAEDNDFPREGVSCSRP